MSAAATFRAMFEPARYPAPRLDGFATAWRYSAAGLWYLFSVSMMIFGLTQESAATAPSTPTTLGTPTAAATVWAGPAGTPSVTKTASTQASTPLPLTIADLALGFVGLLIIRYRRRWPLATYLVLATFTPFSVSSGVVAIWAFLSLASRRDLRAIGIAIAYSWVLNIAAVLFLPWQARSVEPFGPAGIWLGQAAALAMYLVGALAGMYYGVRSDRTAGVHDRADNADRDRELAVLGERNRIAREMHDVLAHRISLVSMHAGALAYRTDLPPEQTREIAQTIQENAHASLNELRSVLSSLRASQVDADGVPSAPQPTLADLPQLLVDAHAAGQRVTLHAPLPSDAVDPVTSRHLYRIVQECLTNARKHAPFAPVEMWLDGVPGEGITLRVANALTARGGGVPGAGLGLVGVRERAAMLGGRLDAGVRQGQFVVDAWLPWPS